MRLLACRLARWLVWAGAAAGAAGAGAQADTAPEVAARSALAAPVAPQRIVSLLPSATEAVCALGACARLVGVDDFSLDPPQVQHLPRLGRTWEPHIEALVQLRPDLVLIGNTPPVRQRLQALGVPVLEVDANTLPEVRQALQRIDTALQLGQADALWARLQTRLQTLARQQQAQPPLRVYLEVDGAMYAAGPQSFLGQLLDQLGAQNIAPASASATPLPFPRLSPEWVLAANPDLIVLAHQGAAAAPPLWQRPGWAHLRAAQQPQRICHLNAAQVRTVTRPGPRLNEAAAILADCLQAARQAPEP